MCQIISSLHAQSLVARILPVVQSGLIPMGPQYDQQAYEAATVLQLGLKKFLRTKRHQVSHVFYFGLRAWGQKESSPKNHDS